MRSCSCCWSRPCARSHCTSASSSQRAAAALWRSGDTRSCRKPSQISSQPSSARSIVLSRLGQVGRSTSDKVPDKRARRPTRSAASSSLRGFRPPRRPRAAHTGPGRRQRPAAHARECGGGARRAGQGANLSEAWPCKARPRPNRYVRGAPQSHTLGSLWVTLHRRRLGVRATCPGAGESCACDKRTKDHPPSRRPQALQEGLALAGPRRRV